MLSNKLMGASSAEKTYIEDVFSTYLYTGNGSTQTINNGIDLAGKGGMVWIKDRTYNGNQNYVQDTVRGITNALVTNSTAASATANVSSASGTGFTLNNTYVSDMNSSGLNLVSWTFRKAPKFFDVVTYTGNGVVRTISHSLGQTPGMIIVKRTDTTGNWWVYHRSLTYTKYANLNLTAAASTDSSVWNADPTDSAFSVGSTASNNASGGTYVAYLFAHDTSTDGLIQCGSFTTDASGNATVNLGWEPQYLLFKGASGTAPATNWVAVDNMRGFSFAEDRALYPNGSGAEASYATSPYAINPTATGFVSNATLSSTTTYIYMAIRRGPMRTPTDATKVYTSSATTNTTGETITTNFPVDLAFDRPKADAYSWQWQDRLRGDPLIQSNSTGADLTPLFVLFTFDNNNGVKTNGFLDGVGTAHAWMFRRAPGFFDVVCYTGTGAARTVNHNLGVAPELMIVKSRNLAVDWMVYNASIGATKYLSLNTIAAIAVDTVWNDTSPTSTVFNLGTYSSINGSGSNYVAYLFASCPGVSKVGSYTGNGSSQTINCGFTNGARFVLIKRTNSTGDWYVWDTARGIVAGNDPHLSLNTTAAEVTTDDTIDPDSTGFIVNQVAATNVNVSGGSYIYLAIA